jgi:hypothetical protein
MTNSTIESELEALFREVGPAHHAVYRETNGEDPEWPLWYAGFLQDRIVQLLKVELTRSELVYLILSAEKERAARDPAANWPVYYARFVLERHRPAPA